MASKIIKGLTVEIGGDTTKLGKALQAVESQSNELSAELGQINRLLRLDPGNTELLAQKQKVLADAVAATSSKLDTLREAERQVQAQFERGEVSVEQVRALQREIIDTERRLDGYKNAVKETADAIDNLGDEAKASADDLNAIADKGFATLAGAATAAVTGLVAAAESTREYRTEMAKLDTAFTDQSFSSEAATETYKTLVGVLGETDQAVEAAGHLAQLADSEEDLATWTETCTGIYATFGASLPIEGLTEAANESVKTGKVTGSLADALNWATISSDRWSGILEENEAAQAAFNKATADGATVEDAFNEALAACATEQERAALVTDALSGAYQEQAYLFQDNNAAVIEANLANEAWTQSLAEVGAAIEPVLTNVKQVGAELLGKLVPVINTMLANLPTVAVVLGGITAALISYKVAAIAATAAEKGMTLAQYAAAAAQRVLNAAMSANPIGIIILAITALVAAFVYLWQNSEEFRTFWINLWARIKEAVAAAVEWFKSVPDRVKNAIADAIPRVKKWGSDLVDRAKTAATNFLTRMGSTLSQVPGKVASSIAGAIQSVITWGTNMVSKAKTAMGNVVQSVTSTLKELPGKVLSIGGDLVKGLWNGINDKLGWLKSKISGFASTVLDGIKSFFGVHSPSTETAWIGDMLDRGLAEGLLDGMSAPVKAMRTVTGGVLDAAQSTGGIQMERNLQQSSAVQAAAVASPAPGISAKLDRILEALERGQVLTIDGKQFVGGTATLYDNTLGQRRALAARGAL